MGTMLALKERNISTVTPHGELHLIPPLTFLKEYARRHEPMGSWAYDTFEELNETFFDCRLSLPLIQWGLTEWGDTYGYYMTEHQKIILHTSLMKKGAKAWTLTDPLTGRKESNELLGARFASHVLLHELMHHANYLDYGLEYMKHRKCHNCQPWVDEINRIAPLLGLNVKAHVCKQRRIREPGQTKGAGKPTMAPPDDSYITYKQMYSFPHNLMPSGYYEKATEDLLKVDFKL